MRRSLKTFTAALALSAATAPAAFADAAAFQGLYGGFSMGLSSADINAITADIDTGFSGDVFVGYNHAIGPNWVIGGELGYGRSLGHDIPALFPASFDVENLVTVSARAGYVTGNTMIYGRLGYQSGDMAINFAPGTPELEGHLFGLGVEHMFAQNFSGRIEVTQSVWDVDGGGAPPGTELESTRVSIGVAYHF